MSDTYFESLARVRIDASQQAVQRHREEMQAWQQLHSSQDLTSPQINGYNLDPNIAVQNISRRSSVPFAIETPRFIAIQNGARGFAKVETAPRGANVFEFKPKRTRHKRPRYRYTRNTGEKFSIKFVGGRTNARHVIELYNAS